MSRKSGYRFSEKDMRKVKGGSGPERALRDEQHRIVRGDIEANREPEYRQALGGHVAVEDARDHMACRNDGEEGTGADLQLEPELRAPCELLPERQAFF